MPKRPFSSRLRVSPWIATRSPVRMDKGDRRGGEGGGEGQAEAAKENAKAAAAAAAKAKGRFAVCDILHTFCAGRVRI